MGYILSLMGSDGIALPNRAMADEVPNPSLLNYVPETVLKKRKSNEEWAVKKREKLEGRKQQSIEGRKFIFKRAEQFIKEFRNKGCMQELDLVQMKHRQKKKKPIHVSVEGQLFVIRIGGTNDMHPKSRKILHLLRLKHIFDGIFLKANEAILDMLQKVEPYVTYGNPNMKSVKELLYKKGRGRIDNQRVPLTDNNIIEQALGKYGVICIEDIVHEIATGGPHFKEVTRFLWPIKLNKPEGLLQKKRTPYRDGGDSGNREDDINELIRIQLLEQGNCCWDDINQLTGKLGSSRRSTSSRKLSSELSLPNPMVFNGSNERLMLGSSWLLMVPMAPFQLHGRNPLTSCLPATGQNNSISAFFRALGETMRGFGALGLGREDERSPLLE
ncbi:hypothetical protein ACLOJK_028255 [Asimina triloba]